MSEFKLNHSIVTKKIIDLIVEFLRKNSRGNRLYQQTQVTDRFNLTAVRLPSIVVRNVSNTQRRIHYDDYIDDITGRVELVPISGDSTLVGSNLVRTNLADSLDYDPRWPLDPTIGYPTGTDITQAIFTSSTGASFNSGVNTGIIITLPAPTTFDPSSLIWTLENPRLDGTDNPINPTFRTVNATGLVLENHSNLNYSQSSSGFLSIPLDLSVLPTGTIGVTGINNIYSGNNTSSGLFPFTGVGISGAGWFQSGTTLSWTNGNYPTFSGASAAGQIPVSGAFYGVDYNYSGPDVHTIAVALSSTQDQFYLIYSGISITAAGHTVIQAVEPDQFIVNASGLVPGLSGTIIKLNDVLWAGDQYQNLTYDSDTLNYAVYGGIYDMSISLECYANSTIEAQELGDMVERFLVEKKQDPYGLAGFNLTSWAQGGQSEEEYINDHIFSTSVNVDGFRFWQEYRGVDLITSASGTAIPSGIFNISGQYIGPGVTTIITYTNPDQSNPLIFL